MFPFSSDSPIDTSVRAAAWENSSCGEMLQYFFLFLSFIKKKKLKKKKIATASEKGDNCIGRFHSDSKRHRHTCLKRRSLVHQESLQHRLYHYIINPRIGGGVPLYGVCMLSPLLESSKVPLGETGGLESKKRELTVNLTKFCPVNPL